MAQVAEARRKSRGRRKVGLSPLQRTNLRSTRSASLRRQHNEKRSQADSSSAMMKVYYQVDEIVMISPSLCAQTSQQQVVFPLCKPLKLQTDQLKDQLTVGSKGTGEYATASLSSYRDSSATSHGQPDHSQHPLNYPLQRKKV